MILDIGVTLNVSIISILVLLISCSKFILYTQYKPTINNMIDIKVITLIDTYSSNNDPAYEDNNKANWFNIDTNEYSFDVFLLSITWSV